MHLTVKLHRDLISQQPKKKRFLFRKLHREKLYQIKDGAGVGREAAAHQSQIRWDPFHQAKSTVAN